MSPSPFVEQEPIFSFFIKMKTNFDNLISLNALLMHEGQSGKFTAIYDYPLYLLLLLQNIPKNPLRQALCKRP